MWAAHAAAQRHADLSPEQIEKVAAAAIAAYLTALAKHNEVVTETRADFVTGDNRTTLHRPVYPEDLRRMAAQIRDLHPVGPRPSNLNAADEDPLTGFMPLA